jgi:hypothetical protein
VKGKERARKMDGNTRKRIERLMGRGVRGKRRTG